MLKIIRNFYNKILRKRSLVPLPRLDMPGLLVNNLQIRPLLPPCMRVAKTVKWVSISITVNPDKTPNTDQPLNQRLDLP